MSTETLTLPNLSEEEITTSDTLDESYASIDFLKPRSEYANGAERLEFHHQFSNGMVLTACEVSTELEGEDGIISDQDTQEQHSKPRIYPVIQIKDSNGQIVFDFETLLPEGYHFVVPHSFDDRDNPMISPLLRHGWLANPQEKYILVGDWRDPKELLALMHEIGHVQIIEDPRGKLPSEEELAELFYIPDNDFSEKRKDFMVNPGGKEALDRFIKALAFSERNAWAWSLRSIRKLSDTLGVDFVATWLRRLDSNQ
jgi:hypothetical protein